MKNKNLFACFAIAVFLSVSSVQAHDVPIKAVNYIKSQYPKAVVRFDGLVILPDGTKYLPIIPAIINYGEDMSIKYSSPEAKDLKSNPDIVVFNDNFALLKLITNQDKVLTVAPLANYPMEIKTGLLPQELIIPHGLVLPEELKGILGNLEIPLYPLASILPNPNKENDFKTSTFIKEFYKENHITEKVKKTVKPKIVIADKSQPQSLKGKDFLITSLSSEYIDIIPSCAEDSEFALKLESIPLNMAVTADDAFLLVSKFNTNTIDLVDIKNKEIIKRIDVESQPNEILITPDNKFAYITSLSQKAIYVLDLSLMKITQKIQVQGMPEKIFLSEDGTKLFYYDKITSNLYCMNLDEKYLSTIVGTYPNASKFLYLNDNIYALLRTDNKLSIKTYVPAVSEVITDKTTNTVKLKKEDISSTDVQNRNNNSVLFEDTGMLYLSSPDYAVRPNKNNKKQSNIIDKKKVLPLATVNNDISDATQTVNVGIKPIDMINYNNYIYVLSTESKQVDVYDIKLKKLVNTIKLPVNGFPSKITRVGNSNIALITNVKQNVYIVFDLAKNKIADVRNINVPVNNLMVIKGL